MQYSAISRVCERVCVGINVDYSLSAHSHIIIIIYTCCTTIIINYTVQYYNINYNIVVGTTATPKSCSAYSNIRDGVNVRKIGL